MDLEELLQRQIEREEKQHELGLEKFQHQLQKQKLGMDYSNSTGGRLIQKTLLAQLTEAVEEAINRAHAGAGINHVTIVEAYEAVSDLPMIDLDSGEVIEGKTTSPWLHEQVALITLRTMLDVCYMPVYEEKKRGQRFGGAPNMYDLERRKWGQ